VGPSVGTTVGSTLGFDVGAAVGFVMHLHNPGVDFVPEGQLRQLDDDMAPWTGLYVSAGQVLQVPMDASKYAPQGHKSVVGSALGWRVGETVGKEVGFVVGYGVGLRVGGNAGHRSL